jgi:hypothetical protein
VTGPQPDVAPSKKSPGDLVQSSEFRVQSSEFRVLERGVAVRGPVTGPQPDVAPSKKSPGDLVQSSEFRVQSSEFRGGGGIAYPSGTLRYFARIAGDYTPLKIASTTRSAVLASRLCSLVVTTGLGAWAQCVLRPPARRRRSSGHARFPRWASGDGALASP